MSTFEKDVEIRTLYSKALDKVQTLPHVEEGMLFSAGLGLD